MALHRSVGTRKVPLQDLRAQAGKQQLRVEVVDYLDSLSPKRT